MRYRQNNSPRIIVAKFAGKCSCCGATIPAGTTVDYYPAKREIAHRGGLDGNSPTCCANIRAKRDDGFVDLDRAYEDQCADICGR